MSPFAVMEIGSSYGVCTAILAQTAASVIGLETSEELIRESRAAYPHVTPPHHVPVARLMPATKTTPLLLL